MITIVENYVKSKHKYVGKKGFRPAPGKVTCSIYWLMSFSFISAASCGGDKHDASSVPHWLRSYQLQKILLILSNISGNFFIM